MKTSSDGYVTYTVPVEWRHALKTGCYCELHHLEAKRIKRWLKKNDVNPAWVDVDIVQSRMTNDHDAGNKLELCFDFTYFKGTT